MSTTVTVLLEPYDGQAHTASDFMDKAEFAAKNTFTGLPNGALSFMYDNATYVERTQTEPTILDPRGPLPVRLNNEAQATFAARKEEWKDNRDMHNECDKGVNAFRTAFVAALPAHILHKVLDGSDLRTITLRELITNFKTKVINKREALAAHQLQLDKPFIAGDSINTHCFTHITAHRAFREFNEELSPLARYNLLAKSLEPCGLFTIVRDQLTIKPVPEQTFEALADAAKAWVHTLSFTQAAERGYANAVAAAAAAATAAVPVPPPPSELDLIRAQLAVLQANAARAQVPTQRNAARAPRQPAPAAGPVPTHYCWSHGHNFSHNGAVDPTTGLLQCTRPRRGHRPDATATQTLGGSTRVYNK